MSENIQKPGTKQIPRPCEIPVANGRVHPVSFAGAFDKLLKQSGLSVRRRAEMYQHSNKCKYIVRRPILRGPAPPGGQQALRCPALTDLWIYTGFGFERMIKHQSPRHALHEKG